MGREILRTFRDNMMLNNLIRTAKNNTKILIPTGADQSHHIQVTVKRVPKNNYGSTKFKFISVDEWLK